MEAANKNLLKIINKIEERYTETPSPELAERGKGYLCDNLVPASDVMLLSGQGITLETDKGKFYDFSAMSLNCILGQNDPWVNANLGDSTNGFQKYLNISWSCFL